MATEGQQEKRQVNILIGVSGSVASVKLEPLIGKLMETAAGLQVQPVIQVVATEHSTHFFSIDDIANRYGVTVFRDQDEWSAWRRVGDPALHIELRRWADVFVIAPLDANTMAKLTVGICDNLLTCIVRAWDVSKPLIYCPAMNTYMWEHPVTAKNTAALQAFGYIEVQPVAKKLACGDVGMGGMASVETITEQVWQSVRQKLVPK